MRWKRRRVWSLVIDWMVGAAVVLKQCPCFLDRWALYLPFLPRRKLLTNLFQQNACMHVNYAYGSSMT